LYHRVKIEVVLNIKEYARLKISLEFVNEIFL
jgi:hypothetical protein